MKERYNRRDLLKILTVTGIGLSLADSRSSLAAVKPCKKENRIGIIGLDTSHSVAFTRAINGSVADPEIAGFRVVAAYPKGTTEIKAAAERIPEYTEEVKKLGVEIVGSIKELLTKVDFVLLETNDGRLHYEQALQVIRAGKPLFIDKPAAASLKDAIAIYTAARKYNVPLFSSSSLRFMKTAQTVAKGVSGRVLSAYTYGPANFESTHPDLFWYGIHAVELLFTVMGTGCISVVRTNTADTDVVTGIWNDGRVATFQGNRTGKYDFGGIVYTDKENILLGSWEGYKPLLIEIIRFFASGKAPVSPNETLEILAFMEAADESKRNGGIPVKIKAFSLKDSSVP